MVNEGVFLIRNNIDRFLFISTRDMVWGAVMRPVPFDWKMK